MLIRHSDIESIFWGVFTAEENSLPHRFLPVFCETAKNGALLPWECRSLPPSPGSARLCWAGCSCLWHWKQAQHLWVSLSLGKVDFFLLIWGNLDWAYILSLKIDSISCLFSFAILLAWQEHTVCQRREKSLNLNPSLPLASSGRVAPLNALRAESLWTFLKLLLTD